MSNRADSRTDIDEDLIDPEASGRFVIPEGRRDSDHLPPSAAEAAGAGLGALVVPAPAGTVPPPIPQAEVSSELDDPGLAELVASFAPPVMDAAERAELDIADLSLRMDNPYAASSLVPPPEPQFPWVKAAGIGGAALVALVGMYFGWSALGASHIDPPDLPAAQAPAAQAPAAPIAAAPIAGPQPATQAAAVEPEEVSASERAALAAEPRSAPEARPVAASPKPVNVEPAPAAAPAIDTPRVDSTAEPVAPAVRVGEQGPVAVAAVATAAPAAVPAASAAVPAASTTDAAAPAIAVAAAAAPVDSLPDLPTREQVSAGFEQVRPALQECAGSRHGIVKLKATIANSGRLAHALIEGVFMGTPEGSCMARAVRRARFPRFAQPKLDVALPLSL